MKCYIICIYFHFCQFSIFFKNQIVFDFALALYTPNFYSAETTSFLFFSYLFWNLSPYFLTSLYYYISILIFQFSLFLLLHAIGNKLYIYTLFLNFQSLNVSISSYLGKSLFIILLIMYILSTVDTISILHLLWLKLAIASFSMLSSVPSIQVSIINLSQILSIHSNTSGSL